ncbi:hypothetical protein [Candidatus Agathobaculum pullicola]|uniref:hypothetical protein n=1 Tax=Candidatus Agathobaculum pullicola TaxID=2838426 RepID=UPI003F91539D
MTRGVPSASAKHPAYTSKSVGNSLKGTASPQASDISTVSWADITTGTTPNASFIVCSSPEDRAAMQAYFSNAF